MKAITLWQPWATFVVTGMKEYETRSWSTTHTGPLAIHAAARTPAKGRRICEASPEIQAALEELGVTLEELPRGAVLGQVWLYGVEPVETVRDRLSRRERALGDYSAGRFAWRLASPARYGLPIPASGRQRMWEWEPPQGFSAA